MPVRIAIFGAGAVGCWVGGRLSAGRADVTLIGRTRVLDELKDGVRTSELGGGTRTGTPALATDASAAETAELVLVTVKSAGTPDAARDLARVLDRHSGPRAVVISLQNGVRNVDALRAGLPSHTVLAGMVPFNVIHAGRGHYHRASAGKLMFESRDAAAPFTEACLAADLPFELRDDMPGVQWGKLVLNLNNAINALSGTPLATELGDRDYRRVLAAAQREALAVLRGAEIHVARVAALPPRLIPPLLAAPDGVFRLLARRLLAIDPSARSSMWDDLVAGRRTEVDYINGEIVQLADKLGIPAPVNTRLVELVRAAEAGGRRDYTGIELRRLVAGQT